MKRRAGFGVMLGLLVFASANAATPILGGDFENAATAWTFSGRAGGFSGIVTQGQCFSSNDTTGIVFEGVRAGIVRTDRAATPGAAGIMTSAPFSAGIGVAFKALTETVDGRRYPDMPVDFTVRVLADDGAPLSVSSLTTSVVALAPDCYTYPVNGAFRTHYIDTRRFTGRQIRIQFEQSSRVVGAGLFTLVDEVVRLDAEDSQVLTDRPRAVAGVSRSGSGRLRLDSSLSTDPADVPLEYFWNVEGESFRREGAFPCIDDLAPGAYQAALVVSNGLYLDTDTVRFVVRPAAEAEVEVDDGVTEEELDAQEKAALTFDGDVSLDCSDSADPGADDETEEEEDPDSTA
ncbi:MAG: hypothetical protein DWQ08_00645 [Proteobacteria bacterium]|nr:MAG: hypothetical protein DWQ08_00645 [Pseudomonadota bacterium]